MSNVMVMHSAKGSVWEKHKYVKKLNGNYYYPVGYKLGRTVDSLYKDDNKEAEESEEEKNIYDLTDDDITELANEVIRGEFGNGQTRKELLGDLYQDVQDLVNEILLGGKSSKSSKKSSKKETTMEDIADVDTSGMEATMKKVLADVSSKAMQKVAAAGVGIDLEKVYNVYKKK